MRHPVAEIAAALFKLGATAYGGPAMMGVMQTELQDKRQWVTRERFVEGLSLVNMLPGATATQLGIFLGYARGGWWGGLLAGLCFVVPGFVIMLALTMAYAVLGVTPAMRGALYGLGPVVLGIFFVAVYRLGRSAVTATPQSMIGVISALALASGSIGVAGILLLAGSAGLFFFYDRRVGLLVAAAVIVALALAPVVWSMVPATPAVARATAGSTRLVDIGAYFFKVGALTVGGGLAMIAFMQHQVVEEFAWLTPQEFIDGLALGQFTPGPVLMLAAYVGYKVAGVAGAAVAAASSFLPSFVLMLVILPALDRVRALRWTQAVMRGMAPAVIGLLAVSLFRSRRRTRCPTRSRAHS